MTKKRMHWVMPAVASMSLAVAAYAGTPLGTGFIYQGQLKEAGVPLNGNVDLRFELFDAETGGNPVGSPLLVEDVPVVNGLFSVELDFGADAFTGEARWVEIEVRSPHDPTDTEPFTPMSPRQPLTAAPYALHAVQTRGIFVDGQSRVAIHKLSPDASLDVNGGIRSSRIDADHSIEIKGNSFVGGELTLRSPVSNKGALSIVSQILDDGNPPSGSSHILFRIGSPFGGVPIVMRITEEGNVAVGSNAPDVRLHVTGGTDASPGGGGYIQAGNTFGANVVIDGNEIMARNNGGTSTLHINNDGGDVIFGGAIDIGLETVFSGYITGEFASVQCPGTKRVVGGGCDTLGIDALVDSFPSTGGRGWRCEYDQGVFGAEEIAAYAICANVK